MTKNKIVVRVIILVSIFSVTACGGVTKRVVSTNTVDEAKFIKVIINDQAIKSEEYGQKFISKIEEVFHKSFENVSVNTGYNDVKSGELLIQPITFSIVSTKLKTGESTSVSITSNVRVITAHYSLDFRISETNDSGAPAAAIIGQVLLLPIFVFPIGGNYNASNLVDRAFSINKALENAAIGLYNKVIISPRFTEYAESAKILKASPSDLTPSVYYADISSFLPNNTIDAGEESLITLDLTNNGKGTAFDVTVEIESAYKNIDFPKVLNAGDIQPGETKAIKIPVKADLALPSGTAVFLVKVHEKRGYDARPVELQVAAQSLQGPKLALESCAQNDASGLAQGNGDNIPQNNETIELSPFIRNNGIGDALKVSVKLLSMTDGIEIVKGSDDLASIGTGTTGRATLAFRIPRTFNKPEIRYTVSATDTRGMSTERTFSIPFESAAPSLYYTYQVVDKNNREISALENGESYTLRITPKNVGNNVAEGVALSVESTADRVTVGQYNRQIGKIQADGIGSMVAVPFSLHRSFTDPKLDMSVGMSQEAFDGISRQISLPVRVKKPELACRVTLLNGIAENAVSQNSRPIFRVGLSNTGTMDAGGVSVSLAVPGRGIAFDAREQIGTIKAGESQYKDFTFFIRGDAPTGDMPVAVNVTQEDFPEISETHTYQLKEQTAFVQKVQSLKGGAAQAAGSLYDGPPELYVNTPNRDSKTYKEYVDLHGNIITFGKGNGLSKLGVYLNGEALTVIPTTSELRLDPGQITKRQVSDEKIVFDGAVNLKHGANTIRIQCVDFNNRTSEQTITVTRQAKLGNIYAVVIGVSQFWNKEYNLKYAASDAEKFYRFLRSEKGGALSDGKVSFLSNEQARRAQVISALTNLLGRTTKDDTVEIYIATHGLMDTQGNLYYLCHDTDIDNLRGTGLSDKEFSDILNENVKAGKVIIYLDVCHAGMSGLSQRYAKRGIGVYEVNERISNLASALSKSNNGVVTFSASSASGSSLEDAQFDGGVFTHCLISGLTGEANSNPNDEWVTLAEMEDYLTKRITVLTSGKQRPKINGTLPGEVPLAKVR